MFVVELVGLPGVGKSTISNLLANRLNTGMGELCLTSDDAFLYALRRYSDKACRILLNIVADPIARVLVKKFHKRTIFQHDKAIDFMVTKYDLVNTIFNGKTFNKMSYADKHIVISGVLQAGSIYESIRSIEKFDRIVIFDEGFIQSSLFMSSPGDIAYDIDELINYIHHIPLPDLVIFLKSDVDTCFDRMSKREKGITLRLKKLDNSKVYESLKLMEEIFSRIIEFLSGNAVKIVEIQSKSTINETVDSIVRSIKPLIANYIANVKRN